MTAIDHTLEEAKRPDVSELLNQARRLQSLADETTHSAQVAAEEMRALRMRIDAAVRESRAVRQPEKKSLSVGLAR